MIILSVDYGRARTGVAVCDKNEVMASPVGVIKEYNSTVLNPNPLFMDFMKHVVKYKKA